MAALVELVRQQYTPIPPLPSVSLEGQTVLVTGASSGLGLEVARHVAGLRPAKLIVTGRDAGRMADALDDIVNSTGIDKSVIAAWSLDMDKYDSIKSFVERVNQHGRLDIAILNAGVSKRSWTTASTGHETTLQSNVYGTFLTLFLLTPLLKQTTHKYRNGMPARAMVVASDTHTWIPTLPDTPTLLADLDSKERTEAAAKSNDIATQQLAFGQRYPISKLLEILIVRELAHHIDEKDLIVATVNPGLCHSGLMRDATGLLGWAVYLFKLALARPTETGARAILYGGVADQVKSGHYYNNSTDYEVSPYVSSAAGAKAGKLLYEELIADLAKVDKRVSQAVA